MPAFAIPAVTALGKLGAKVLTKRFAGQALKSLVGKDLASKPGQLAARLAPDAFSGLMVGSMTPGDLGDKLIAGTTTTLGGGLGGIAAGRAANAMKLPDSVGFLADLGGSYAGDQVGFMAGDSLMRAKGGGTTPYEKQAIAYEEQMKAQMEEEFRRKYGIGGADPFLAEQGLG